jgi:hypothetical protein
MISRRHTVAASAVIAALAFSASAASAQQASAPDQAQLYSQMIAVMQNAGGVHVQETTATLPTGPRQTIRENFFGSADVSSQQQVMHVLFKSVYTSVRNHKVIYTQRTEAIANDGRFAQRNGGGRWYCQPLPQEYWQGSAAFVFTILPVTPHFIGGVASATVLGATGWRVKIDLGNGTYVLNIAQDSYRLVRITETSGVKTAAQGLTKRFTDFSRYGEAVAAPLPQACR